MLQFQITPEERAKINKWLAEEVHPILVAEQKASGEYADNHVAQGCWEDGMPYTGAIGGAASYSFTPTSLGVITKVSYYNDRFELDLTDFGSW